MTTTPQDPLEAIASKVADYIWITRYSSTASKDQVKNSILAAIREATAVLRAENERLKADSAAIAENDPFNPKTGQAIADMINAFLCWPLPDSVCSDKCVTMAGAKHRIGTNLMTVTETMQMVQEVVCPIITKYMKARRAMSGEGGERT